MILQLALSTPALILIFAHVMYGQAPPQTRLRAQACSPDRSVCVFISQTVPTSDRLAVIVEGPPTAKWLALGLGVTTMAKTNCYVGYVDAQNKNPTVSIRQITGFSPPTALGNDAQTAQPNPNVFGITQQTNKFVVQFTAVQPADLDLKRPIDLIWAMGTTAPNVTKANQYDAKINKHSAAGTVKLNMADPTMQQAYDSALEDTAKAFELFRQSGGKPPASPPSTAGAAPTSSKTSPDKGAGAVAKPPNPPSTQPPGAGTAAPNTQPIPSSSERAVLVSQYLVGCILASCMMLGFLFK